MRGTQQPIYRNPEYYKYYRTGTAVEPAYYRYDTITGTVRQTTLRLYQYATYGTPKTVPCTVLDLDLDLARSTCSMRYSSTRSSK